VARSRCRTSPFFLYPLSLWLFAMACVEAAGTGQVEAAVAAWSMGLIFLLCNHIDVRYSTSAKRAEEARG
jgi:hypothetical protein